MGKIKEAVKRITPQPVLDAYHSYKSDRAIKQHNYVKQKMKPKIQRCLAELNETRSIDCGNFLQSVDNKIVLPELTFVGGGSTPLDYAFLKAVAIKYQRKNYLEIGTYIGESIRVLSDVCDKCHSITATPGSPYSMSNWCKEAGIPDFTERLTNLPNIYHHFVEDSKSFDYILIKDDIDLYFIDADHRYEGVYADTKNVFANKSEDAIVVWHDFKGAAGWDGSALAVHDFLGNKEWENVYCVDNNICGIYLPKKYQTGLPLRTWKWTEERQPLYVYTTTLTISRQE